MLIIAGHLTVDRAERDECVAACASVRRYVIASVEDP